MQPMLDLTSLMKSFIELIGLNVSYQSQLHAKADHHVQEQKFDIATGERDTHAYREIRKRLDIIYRVFKQASQKLNRVDRNWQEVLDATVYIIEEVKADSSVNETFVAVRRDKAQSPLDQAITDFQFVLGRAIESVNMTGAFTKPVRLTTDNTMEESLVTAYS